MSIMSTAPSDLTASSLCPNPESSNERELGVKFALFRLFRKGMARCRAGFAYSAFKPSDFTSADHLRLLALDIGGIFLWR